MRELIQHSCQSRRVFFPQKPPMEVAAVSTAARDSGVTVSAVGWHGSWHEKGHGKGKSREKGKGKGKGKGKKGKEKGGEKGNVKSNSGKGKGNWWHDHDQRWVEPFRGYCGHCWKWGQKKAQCPQWQGRRPIELDAMVSHPSQTVVSDPGSSVSQRVRAVNSSPVSPVCWSESAEDEEDWPDVWDIQDQKIEAHGKKIVDEKFHGQANETPVPASVKVGCVRCCENCCLDGQIAESRIRSALHESRPQLVGWKMDFQEQQSVKTVQRQRLLSAVWMSKCCLRRENPAKAGQQQV